MKKNWHAVYTRIKCEKKVVAFLEKKKIDCFFPTNSVLKNMPFEKTKKVEEPLFPSYVFIKASEEDFTTVRECYEIINFLFWMGKPIQFKEIEIENLIDFSGSYFNIQIEKIPVSLNNMVRIVNKYPFNNSDQNVVPLNNSQITLTLPTLGYKLIAETNETIESINALELSGLVVS